MIGGVFDRNGKYVVGTQKIVDLKLKDQTLDSLPDSGITVKTNLDVASGDYVVRLVVRDSEGTSNVGAEWRRDYSVKSHAVLTTLNPGPRHSGHVPGYPPNG